MPVTTTDTNPTPTETEQSSSSRLRPRRTLNRLALAGTGVIAGLLGQAIFAQDSLWDGLLLYGVAVAVFVRALAPHLYPAYKFTLLNPQSNQLLTIRSGWRRNGGVWLILLAVVASILAWNFFGRDDALAQAWWLYGAGLGLFMGGGLLLTPGASLRAELQRLIPNRPIALGLSVIAGLALLMRLHNFGSQPFGIWFDEAEAGLQARRILNEPAYRPIFYPAINVSGQFLMLYALALRWLGDNIHALRLVNVLFGLGGVAAAYLFGRELRGPRFGLALAFFMAVARWPVNFSRVAMTGIDAPFFEFLTLYFLTRLFKYGRLRDALWAGLTLGLGLIFYAAFRLYLLALIIFALVSLIRWWPQVQAVLQQKSWRNYLGAAILVAISVWLVVMPLVKFAVDEPQAFWYRTRQISILTKRDQADLTRALWNTTRQHLLMFNFQGDRNGRHNLPGEPMLDPLLGVLFVLGFGLAVARTRHPANTFFIILFFAALVGGIFSVDFEAPQSLRSIAVIPAVIYFCALAVAVLGNEAESALQSLPKFWLVAPLTVAAGYIFMANAHTYFVRQANDFASWNAFSAPETITGQKMAELGPDYVYILSPFLANHPTTHFLAPHITNQQYLQVPDALPIRDPSGRPVAIFIHPDEAWIYDRAEKLYPAGHFEIIRGPSSLPQEDGPPSVYFVNLQPGDLMAVRGLELRYWPIPPAGDAPPFIAPLSTSRALTIDATWPQDAPVTEDDFVAEWAGVLYAPHFGPTNFRLITPGKGLLEIDGNALFEGQGEQFTTLTLAQGNHLIRVRAESAPGQVALYWQPPGQGEELVPAWAFYAPPITNNGLQGSFFANNNWQGQPVLQRIDPFLDTYFHLIPLPRPYTVEWAGALLAPQSGLYKLALRVVQEAELFIDGQSLLSTTGPNEYTEAPIKLEQGLHDILIRYRDTVDRSRAHLLWTPPGGVAEPIPGQYLYPPMGRYPEPPPTPQDAADIVPLTLQHLFSLGGPGQFFEPRDVAVLSNGNLVVADTGARRVQVFGPQFNHLFDLTGNDLPFEEPLAVGVNSKDEIFVLDSTLQWVYRYDAGGNFIDRFGGPEARLFHPRGLTVLPDDTIALADTGQARVAFFNLNGQHSGNIGTLGASPGQLNEPTDVLRDAQGTYFVAEAENDRIQRLDAGGNPLNQWAISPAYAYNGPHLAFAPDGSIFVTESQSDVLLRYAPNGVLIDQWHTIGPVNLLEPVGIYFDPATNRLYVTDVVTHQIHLFWVQPAAGQVKAEN
jgi:DNA-binding beta-propeller fold protein YncE